MTYDALKGHEVFISPIPMRLILSYGPASYRNIGIKQLETNLNCYPLKHNDWVEAQKVVAKYFHGIIRREWSEKIASEIWEYIKDDFTFDPSTCYSEDSIDENLMHIFKQMKSY